MTNDAPVRHVPERSRFEVEQDGAVAVLTYEREGDTVSFLHTVVPVELEGRGLGGHLAAEGVGWATGQGLGVVAVCTFVRGWLERHPEALSA